ncbi:transmembrane protein 244-like [Haliotis rufescens]|uniref:transmembrane protein 244-like n=1 Tax=Haliotis rufescens TaxID=6454 RepID=UPI00201ECB6A|nr:transmembrane protein 244-like [Haliotis rufescens]
MDCAWAAGTSCVMGARLSTKEVLLNVLKCLVIFYSLYYVVSSICFAAYRLDTFDGKIPFDFHTWIDLTQCCNNYTSKQMVNLISMEVTYAVSGLGYSCVSYHWVWDYSVTTIIIHILLCSAVMLNFPVNWSWWICLGCGLLMQIGLGELVALVRQRKKLARVTLSPEQEPMNFLYRRL